jgi:hypothetical protein
MHSLPLTILAIALAGTPVSATRLEMPEDPESFGCRTGGALVIRWTPADGPPAAFLAKHFVEGGGNTLITLGADATGIWTAETDSDDACGDDCSELYLVHTGFDGKRQPHLVASASGMHDVAPEARFLAAKQALFALAAGPWKVAETTQDYRLVLPKRSAEGVLERYTGWFAEVRVAGKPGVRFGLATESMNCWCFDHWRAYPLRT